MKKSNSWVTKTTVASESNVHSVARIPNVGGKCFVAPPKALAESLILYQNANTEKDQLNWSFSSL